MKTFPGLAGLCVIAMMAANASAATIWTDWTSATAGSNGGGSAAGSLGGITVSYSGELDTAVTDGTSPIWGPLSTYTGGTVDASPSTVGDELRLNGASTSTNTITFGSPIQNLVFAFFSLGSIGPSDSASFTFIGATPAFQAGGPNSTFGGVAITVVGNVVSGQEANGVVQLTGSFSSISWTNTQEQFGNYAFTVGSNEEPSAVPEPASLALAAGGLGLLAVLRRRRGAEASSRP